MAARVSIIIPCYNQSGYVTRAVGSALPQMGDDDELILVNDGSTDRTAEVIEEIRAAHPGRVATVSQANQGLAMARQAGLERAGGEYIVFLDADDWLLPGMLGACLAGFGRRPDASVVVGRTRVVYENETSPPTILRPGSNTEWPEILAVNPFGSPCSMMLRKKDLLAAGGTGLPGCRACEDWDLYARMARRGMKFEIIDAVLAAYVQHENALSRDPDLMLREKIALLDRMAAEAAGLPALPPEVYDRCRNGQVLFMIGEAAGKLETADRIGRIADCMVRSEVAFRYFCNQFLYGLQHSAALARTKLGAEYIEQVRGTVEKRFEELGFGRWGHRLGREFRREMKAPMKRLSLARRISRLLDRVRGS